MGNDDLSTVNQPEGTTRIENGIAYDITGKILGKANVPNDDQAASGDADVDALAKKFGGSPSPSGGSADADALAAKFGGSPGQLEKASEDEPTEANLPGSTPQLRAAVAAGKGPAPKVTQFEKDRPQPGPQDATDATPIVSPYVTGLTFGDLKRFYGGIKSVAGFASDVVKDISNPNKPLFFSEKGAPEGSEGESTFYKYGVAPQVDQFKKAQELERLAQEEERKGNQTLANNYHTEAEGHWAASVVPMVGPWVAGHAQKAGETGDIRGEVAEFAGEAAGGELMSKAGGVAFDKVSRMTGDVVEHTVRKMGASPKVAEAVGNIAALGTLKPLDAHMRALDDAVDTHIAAEHDFDLKTKELESAKERAESNPKSKDFQNALKDAQESLDRSDKARNDASNAVDKIQDNIIREVDGKTWSKLALRKIGDIVGSVLGKADNFNDATARFASVFGKQAGQEFSEKMSKVSEDMKAITNENSDAMRDPNTAAAAIDRHIQHNIEAPMQETSGAVHDETRPVTDDFLQRAEARIDKFLNDNRAMFGNEEAESAIKERLMDRLKRQEKLENGSTAPRPLNLFEAENARRGLNQYNPTDSNGFRAAAGDLANFLREVIDESYGKRGVKRVKESRTREANLIDVRDAIKKAQTLFEKQQSVPTLSKLWKMAKNVGVIGSIGALLLHSNIFGALGAGASLWEAIRHYNITDVAGNLERMKQMAAREPGAKAVVPEVGEEQLPTPTPGPGEAGPTPAPPGVPPGFPPPPTPPEPVRPPSVNARLNGILAAHFMDPKAPYEELTQRFLKELDDMIQERKNIESKGGALNEIQQGQWEKAQKVLLTMKTEHAAEDLRVEEKNKANQEKYSKELSKYNAKVSAEKAKLAGEKAKEATQQQVEAAQKKEAERLALVADERIAHSVLQATEVPISIINTGDGRTSEQAHGHEGGHIMTANAEGLEPTQYLTAEHPDVKEDGGQAQVHVDTSNAEPGVKGIASRVVTALGGPAYDEVHNGIKLGRNTGSRADIARARQILREEGGLRGAALEKVFDFLYDRAKQHVSNPEALAIMQANLRVREAGLHPNYHMSPGRIIELNKKLQGIYGKTPSTEVPGEGPAGRGSDGATDAGGAGEEQNEPAEGVRAEDARKADEGAAGKSKRVEKAALTGSEQYPEGALKPGEAEERLSKYEEAQKKAEAKEAADKKAFKKEMGFNLKKSVAESADEYNKESDRVPVEASVKPHEPAFAKRVADSYEAMKHEPENPAVAKSYDALKKEVKKQWDYAQNKMGVKFEPWNKEGQPYASSKEMVNDVRNNGHLYFFQGGDMPADHPMAETDPKTGLTYNDIFRAVHDLFGHAAHGFEFGPKGEENAYQVHRQMFPQEAIPALTSETRGQNSWVNFGKHLRNAEGNVPGKGEEGFVHPKNRPYAEQKAGLLPEEFHGVKAEPKDWATSVEKAPFGGVNPNNPEAPSKTYGFEIAPEHRHNPEALTAAEARAYAERPEVKAALAAHPDIKLGWDTTTQGPELNIGASTDDLATAKKIAGKLDQRAIVNTRTGEEILAGGEGKKTSFPDYPMDQRLKDLGIEKFSLKKDEAPYPKNEEGVSVRRQRKG